MQRLFIVYTRIDENTVPIVCSSMKEDPIREDFVLLSNVVSMTDSTVQGLRIRQIAVQKKDILYYVFGEKDLEEEKDELQEEDDTSEADDQAEDSSYWE